jgi:hypothetical protein
VKEAASELGAAYLGLDCRSSAVSSLERGPTIQGTPEGWIVVGQSPEAETRVGANVTVKVDVSPKP